jgi:ribosomal protein S6--L-glutamate ligase
MDLTAHRPAILHRGRSLSYDAVVPRIGASNTFYGTAVVRQFEVMGVFSVNGSEAITRARDKLRSLQLLAREGIGLPVTGFAHSTKDVDGLIEIVGGAPLVVKLLEGTQGVGVVLAETKKAAHSVIGAFLQLDANILVQQYVKEARGSDVRAFVVGEQVIAAMRREAAPGEFRANLHRGGRAEAVALTVEEREAAVRAVRTLGLDVAGVDFLRGAQGPLVIEVNASPGLEGIEGATGTDVAAAVVGFVEANAGDTQPRRRARG